MDAGSEPAGAIEFSDLPVVCPTCESFRAFSPRLRVIEISQVKTGWITHGEIQLTCSCPGCGTVFNQIVQYIPIECASFPCPSCGPGSKLTPEILNITEAEMGYSFVVLLKCDACSKQRRLSKLLGGLSKITRVKVGPTGVEVEVKP
jgi:uncharacterized Zn finger protein